MLPAAGAEPLIDHLETIRPPERLTVHEKERGAANTAFNGFLARVDEHLLHPVFVDRGEGRRLISAGLTGDPGNQTLGLDGDAISKVGVVGQFHKCLGQHRIALAQPLKLPARRLRRYGKLLRECPGNIMEPGYPGKIVDRVLSLEGLSRQ